MPLPNIDGAAARQNNFVSSPSQEQTFNQYMLRLDHTFNQKWSVFYRHFLQDNTDFNPFQGSGPANYLGFADRGRSRARSTPPLAVNAALSSSLLNELRVGRSSNDNVSRNLPLLNPKDFGINYDRNQDTAGGLGLPDITINGLSGIGNTIQGPTTNPSYEWQISNVLSKSAGRHLLKIGRRVPPRRRRLRSRVLLRRPLRVQRRPTRATRSRTSCSGAPSSSTTPRAAPSSRCGTRTSARSSRTTSRYATT